MFSLSPMRRIAISRTTNLVIIVALAFNLGRYAEHFSGSGWAWAAVILSGIGLVTALSTQLLGIWKQRA